MSRIDRNEGASRGCSGAFDMPSSCFSEFRIPEKFPNKIRISRLQKRIAKFRFTKVPWKIVGAKLQLSIHNVHHLSGMAGSMREYSWFFCTQQGGCNHDPTALNCIGSMRVDSIRLVGCRAPMIISSANFARFVQKYARRTTRFPYISLFDLSYFVIVAIMLNVRCIFGGGGRGAYHPTIGRIGAESRKWS